MGIKGTGGTGWGRGPVPVPDYMNEDFVPRGNRDGSGIKGTFTQTLEGLQPIGSGGGSVTNPAQAPQDGNTWTWSNDFNSWLFGGPGGGAPQAAPQQPIGSGIDDGGTIKPYQDPRAGVTMANAGNVFTTNSTRSLVPAGIYGEGRERSVYDVRGAAPPAWQDGGYQIRNMMGPRPDMTGVPRQPDQRAFGLANDPAKLRRYRGW